MAVIIADGQMISIDALMPTRLEEEAVTHVPTCQSGWFISKNVKAALMQCGEKQF